MSGDLPESTPKELSQYEKIIELLTTLFPLWVLMLYLSLMKFETFCEFDN